MSNQSLPSCALEFREGSSDKVYRACIETADGGFVVNFAYGRRGATLNTGSKTPGPVPYAEAASIYEKLVHSKTAKGYRATATSSDAGLGVSMPTRQRHDTGMRAQLLNPITEQEAEQYLVDADWCAQEKFDGKRMLLHRSGPDIMAVNRDGLATGLPDALVEPLSRYGGGLAENFVIDGESVGETFYAFDLLESAAGCWRTAPYRDRLEALRQQFGKLGQNIVVARTATGEQKRTLLKSLRAGNKEGIVFKDLGASWSAGRPASGGSAMKCKFWATASCVVAGMNARRSIAIALGGRSIGNVTIPPNHQIPAIGQVVEIRYLYCTGVGGSLYQPIYRGERDDVSVRECTVERQRIKYKPQDLAA